MSKAEKKVDPRTQASNARAAARALLNLTDEERQEILRAIATSLEDNTDLILQANKKDVEAAETMKMSDAMRARLVMNPKKLATLADGLRSIAAQEEPIGKVLRKTQIADGLVLTQETVPIGMLMIIFESRPDCLPQIAGLAIRSGNGLLLKGGKEAVHSCRALHRLIAAALEASTNGRVSGALIALIETRDEVAGLLQLDGLVDLIIPRGSGALVKYIKDNTTIPVLGHADGVCHVYIDAKADMDKAIKIIIDSKTDYPAACNAMETMLVHQDLVADGRAARLVTALEAATVTLYGGPRAVEALGLPPAKDLHTEYGDLTCSVEIVDGVDQALEHIISYGSGHTECVVTEDAAVAGSFVKRVDAACAFHNCSTRFADGYRFGLGAEVGISTGRIHARGPVGVEGLTTTKWKMMSETCDLASEFSAGDKTFIHKALTL